MAMECHENSWFMLILPFILGWFPMVFSVCLPKANWDPSVTTDSQLKKTLGSPRLINRHGSPLGKPLHNYGKCRLFMGNLIINGQFSSTPCLITGRYSSLYLHLGRFYVQLKPIRFHFDPWTPMKFQQAPKKTTAMRLQSNIQLQILLTVQVNSIKKTIGIRATVTTRIPAASSSVECWSEGNWNQMATDFRCAPSRVWWKLVYLNLL